MVTNKRQLSDVSDADLILIILALDLLKVDINDGMIDQVALMMGTDSLPVDAGEIMLEHIAEVRPKLEGLMSN